jgi:hypothetical protein
MLPTVAAATVRPHPQSHPTYAACLMLTTPPVSSMSTVSYRAAHRFPASAHRLSPSHEHAHHLILSFACLGFEEKADFSTSPLPSLLHRSHRALLFSLQPLAAASSRQSSWLCTTPYQDRHSTAAKAISEAGAFLLVSPWAPHRHRASLVNLSPDRHLTELRCHPAKLHGPANCTKDRRPTSRNGMPLLPRFTIVDSIGKLLSIPFSPQIDSPHSGAAQAANPHSLAIDHQRNRPGAAAQCRRPRLPCFLAVGCQPRPSQPMCWAGLEAGQTFAQGA